MSLPEGRFDQTNTPKPLSSTQITSFSITGIKQNWADFSEFADVSNQKKKKPAQLHLFYGLGWWPILRRAR